MFHLCSLGSNINPKSNLSWAIEKLLEEFEELTLSSIILTKPAKMQSQQDFLNALFIIQTEKTSVELKTLFDQWETLRGRNKQDPKCKTKDRTLDIDLLDYRLEPHHFTTQIDDFLDAAFSELMHQKTDYFDIKTPLQINGQTVGLVPLLLNQKKALTNVNNYVN